MKLLRKWDAEHVSYDEHRVELSQAVLDEARGYGDLVPIEWGLTSFWCLITQQTRRNFDRRLRPFVNNAKLASCWRTVQDFMNERHTQFEFWSVLSSLCKLGWTFEQGWLAHFDRRSWAIRKWLAPSTKVPGRLTT
jgi:hypothetical protein